MMTQANMANMYMMISCYNSFFQTSCAGDYTFHFQQHIYVNR